MATFRQDGRPAISPVTAAVDAQGRVIVSTRETAMKVKHLRRDPRVALTAFTDRFYGDWVQVEGTAEIVALPEAMDLLVDYYRTRQRRAPGLGRLPRGDGARPARHRPVRDRARGPERQRLTFGR